eukprot:Sdes_comp14876_c0_seq1m3607
MVATGFSNVLQALYRKKPICPPKEGANELKRCLSLLHIISYGIGSAMGAGIFVTSGQIASTQAGPAVVLCFVFAGTAALLSGLCYAEFSARFPVAGSAYTYAYVSMGEFIAWIVGWNLTLEYALSAATVAAGWSGYLKSLINTCGGSFPPYLVEYNVPGVDWLVLNPVALILVTLCTLFLLLGVDSLGRFTLYSSVFNILIVLFVIFLGASYIDVENYTPFVPFSFGGIISGAGTSFFSYIGFDAVSGLSAEVKNPQKVVPLGLIGSLVVITLLYCGVGFVITGMQHYSTIDPNAALSQAFTSHGVTWAAIIVALGSLTCITVVTLCSLLGQPRIFYAMAKDGLLFAPFARLNENQVPAFGTIVTGVIASALALLINFSALADMVSAGTLMAFSIVCVGCLLNRMVNVGEENCSFLWRFRSHLTLGYYFIGNYAFFLLFSQSHYLESVAQIMTAALFLLIIPAFAVVVVYFWTPRNQEILPFMVPCMPVVPLLGVSADAYLFSGLNWLSYAYLGIWTAIGLFIYCGYGMWHSQVRLSSGVTDDLSVEVEKVASAFEEMKSDCEKS